MNTEKMLKEWNDPLLYHDVNSADDLINALRIELAGKKAVIKELQNDIKWYKNTKDQRKVVLVIHENGDKEYCRIVDGIISGSVGYTAMNGDINKAREYLYKNKEIIEE